MVYTAKTPAIVKPLYRDLVWNVNTRDKVLYLTFDDGPIPEVTPWVLDQLAAHQAKATFFCIGDNVAKHPTVYERLLAEGHAVGNHTFNHLNGWKTRDVDYLQNINACAELVSTNLLRPPYGKISRSQIAALKGGYHIIMWDVLSADFDPKKSPEQCLRNVVRHAGPGSIVVFHDSLKAETRMRYALPRVLEHFSGFGYRFDRLSSDLLKKLPQPTSDAH